MGSAHDAGEPPRAGITFTDDALDDLRRIGHDAARKVLTKFKILLKNVEAGPPLRDELTGFRKLVVGKRTWRVVYRIEDSKTIVICEIWAIGPRADGEVYREATQRVAEARSTRPQMAALADILESLGRQARPLEAALRIGAVGAGEEEDIVPGWLAERLIHTVGLRSEVVAALRLPEAISRWESYMRGER